MSDTEAIQTPKKTKTPRSQEQLLVLAEARKKAYAVRAENAELRKQEKEMEKELKAQEKADRVAKVKAHQEAKKKPKKAPPQEELKIETDFVEDSSEEEEEIIVKKRPKTPAKKPKKPKKTRVVYETDSEEELQEEPPRPRVNSLPPAPTPQQILRRRLYSQMFSM